MPTLPDLSQRATYQSWTSERLRFSDTDMVGHVNNVAFAALIETGRSMFIRGLLRDRPPRQFLLVMARLEMDYRAELHWPAEIDVGTTILGVGNTSIRMGNAVFKGTLCAATATTILVAIDRATRKPVRVPQEVRDFVVER